jgi:hypothetical protein
MPITIHCDWSQQLSPTDRCWARDSGATDPQKPHTEDGEPAKLATKSFTRTHLSREKAGGADQFHAAELKWRPR